MEMETGSCVFSRLQTLDEVKAHHVLETLTHYKGHISKSCKSLKISRATLYRIVKGHNIDLGIVRKKSTGVW